MERITEFGLASCAGKEPGNPNTHEGVREPSPREFIKHYSPAMRPSLRRRNGEITLLVMDENGHMKCLILSERDMNEMVLSAGIINQEIARERIRALQR